MDDDVLRAVQLKYNIDFTLKPEQKSVITHLLNKKDVCGLLPTGFGKSVTYILVPLILNELQPEKKSCALVVSPLKALMKDQVSQLAEKKIDAIAILEDITVKDVASKDWKVIFLSPEIGIQSKWKTFLKKTYKDRICLLVFDEAHCISSWGLEFRPSYRQIPALQSLFDVPNLILTATATTSIQRDVYQVLGIQTENTELVAALPNRPGIFLHLQQSSEKFEVELKWIIDQLETDCKKMIVYVRSVNLCYQLYLFFISSLMDNLFVNHEPSAKNRKVEMFHANTDQESKERILEEFVKTDSNIRVLISTVAFGMGINIPDVDIVVHWGLPSSPLSYWQEIGRCARDGRAGYAVCYAFKRSYSKLKDDDFKEIVKLESCLRTFVLKFFFLDGMCDRELNKLKNLEDCGKKCDNCSCLKCSCCIICRKTCKCQRESDNPLLKFLS